MRVNPHLLIPAILVLLCFPAQAQETLYLGLNGGVASNWHNADMPLIVAEPECGHYTFGTGGGLFLGLVGEMPLLDWLRGSARLTYSRLGGTMVTHCSLVEVDDPQTQEPVPLVRKFTFNSDLQYAMIELGAKAYPLEFPLYGTLMFGAGVPIVATSDENERIVSPTGIRYPDGTIRRENYNGDINDTQTRLALIGGVGYDFSFNQQIEVSPEISYHHALNNVTGVDDWHINSMRFGVSFKWMFDISPKPEPIEPEPVPEPLPEPEPAAKPDVAIGTTTDASVMITETYVTETFPLLPYVFFEQGSAEMIDRYARIPKRSTAAFTESTLPRKSLPIYYHLLNIVGYRMRRMPDAKITLIGSTDDKGSEKGNDSLALARAEAVKDYLTEIWGIPDRRIALRSQALPPIPTSRKYAEGDEENRRVDIVSDTDELFRPVVHEKFSEFDINPPAVTFEMDAEAVERIDRWRLEITFSGGVAETFAGAGVPPDTLHWDLSDDLAVGVQSEDKLIAALTVYDVNGEDSTSTVEIPVIKRLNEFEVGRLSLIVFDFDKSQIRGQNRRMIEQFVATAIHPTSTAAITGSTDILGEEDYNKELSAARAESVKNIILSQNPEIESITARGIGEAPHLYDNTLPEGRFYSRTVSVVVKTPLK